MAAYFRLISFPLTIRLWTLTLIIGRIREQSCRELWVRLVQSFLEFRILILYV